MFWAKNKYIRSIINLKLLSIIIPMILIPPPALIKTSTSSWLQVLYLWSIAANEPPNKPPNLWLTREEWKLYTQTASKDSNLPSIVRPYFIGLLLAFFPVFTALRRFNWSMGCWIISHSSFRLEWSPGLLSHWWPVLIINLWFSISYHDHW